MTSGFPNIERALSEGVSAVSFGPLEKWTQDELLALVEECNKLHEVECKAIEEWYQKQQFTLGNFMSADRSKRLMDLRNEAIIDSLGKTSEMCAVAMMFLPEEPICPQIDQSLVEEIEGEVRR